MTDNTSLKKHLTLVQCVQSDKPPSTPEDFDKIRKWVDRAVKTLQTAITRDLEDVHTVQGMEDEKLLLKNCIDEGTALINDATHILKSLSQELGQ